MIKETPNKITAVLKVTATAMFFDDEASEETVRYAIQCCHPKTQRESINIL